MQKLLHVRHPNVTHIYDAFEFKGAYYLISERCDQTLSDLMSATWFNGRAGNVMARFIQDEMTPKESVVTFKLGDFGLAKVKNALEPNGVF